ncbi:hypothetical protein ACNKHW_24405 [Shigella flexneri]
MGAIRVRIRYAGTVSLVEWPMGPRT